jgi:hypothetical protein
MVCASERFTHNLASKFTPVWFFNTQYSILTVMFFEHLTYSINDNAVVLKFPAVRPEKSLSAITCKVLPEVTLF